MEKLLIAQVLKPQGIKGEVKIKLIVDGFFSIKGVKTIYDEKGVAYAVSNLKDVGGGFAFLSVDGITDRNGAELLRNKSFYADKKDVKKDSDAFFISDLIGVKLVVGEEEIGEIKDVVKSNVDIFEIKKYNGKTTYFPFLKKLNYQIDLSKKVMTVDKDAFLEVAVDEG